MENSKLSKPFIFCIDVGSPKNIGWADSDQNAGTGEDLASALDRMTKYLCQGRSVALGFEAPIWTPKRKELAKITGNRGGVEKTQNRAWSAGAGTGALGAALALMPWCFAYIEQLAGSVATTVDLKKFQDVGGLFIWEAFVSGKMKAANTNHRGDAQLACGAFHERWPDLVSDIPVQPATNHAVSSAWSSGLEINPKELVLSCLVISPPPLD
jgi:hypothetical protein